MPFRDQGEEVRAVEGILKKLGVNVYTGLNWRKLLSCGELL
jgi:hypothetical protein